MRKMTVIVMAVVAIILTACEHTGTKRIPVEASAVKPDWVDSPASSWSKDGEMFFRSMQTVRGDQLLNGCYTLAMHDNYEQMLRSISYDIKGAIDDAQMSLNEDAEIILNKVRSGKFDAMVTGLRDAEQYFERNDYCNQKTKVCKERIYCWMVSSITSEDYERAKRRIVNKISEADPRVHEAIINKTIDFFSEKKPALQEDKKADNIPNADSPAKGTDDTDAETNGEISMDMPLNQ